MVYKNHLQEAKVFRSISLPNLMYSFLNTATVVISKANCSYVLNALEIMTLDEPTQGNAKFLSLVLLYA